MAVDRAVPVDLAARADGSEMPAVERPEFLPDPDLEGDEMESLQADIAAAATFEDDHEFRLGAVDGQVTLATDDRGVAAEHSDDRGSASGAREDGEPTALSHSTVVAGVDQAFLDDGRAVSAVVAMQDGEVIETVTATDTVEIPYVPGLLAFREGGSIASALERLSAEPDVLLVDGSGRIHFREAGLATHVGVLFDLPAVGVAKSLLCGSPVDATDGLVAGERVAIEADDSVSAPDGETIGYALQTRQFDSPNRHVNPVYVSPGHRVSASTAAELAFAACEGYKLPEPIRRADRIAGDYSE